MIKLESLERKQYERLEGKVDEISDNLWDKRNEVEKCYKLWCEHVGTLINSRYELTEEIIFGLDSGKRLREEFEKLEKQWLNSDEFLENFTNEYEIEEDDMILEGLSCTVNDVGYDLSCWGEVIEDVMNTMVKQIEDKVKLAKKCWQEALELLDDKCGIYVNWGSFKGIEFLSLRDECGNIVNNNMLAYYNDKHKEIYLTKKGTWYKEEEIVRIMCHEACHWVAHRYFKERDAHADNSVVFAMVVTFINKHLGLSTVDSDIRVNVSQNGDYGYKFRTEHYDLWKFASDGRRTFKTLCKFIREYMKDNEDLRIIPED